MLADLRRILAEGLNGEIAIGALKVVEMYFYSVYVSYLFGRMNELKCMCEPCLFGILFVMMYLSIFYMHM